MTGVRSPLTSCKLCEEEDHEFGECSPRHPTADQLPIASISPALFVGEVPLVEYEEAGPNVYRFFAFEFAKLRQVDPISLGWPYSPERKVKTNFRYQPRGGIPGA
jgi:hypothetical protein